MAAEKEAAKKHIVYHDDGSVWAKGQNDASGDMVGYWKWFRKDGTKMVPATSRMDYMLANGSPTTKKDGV
jgi:hypothetical protein